MRDSRDPGRALTIRCLFVLAVSSQLEVAWARQCPEAFPHQSSTLPAICYTEEGYAAAGTGPCGSWCTRDMAVGEGCPGSNDQRMCSGGGTPAPEGTPAPDRAAAGDSEGLSTCLNTRRAPVMERPSRRVGPATGGLHLIKALIKTAVDKTLDEIVGQAVSSLFGLSDGNEETCQEHLKIDFCNDAIFHSVSEEVHKKKNERDTTAKKTYHKIIESEVKGAGSQYTTMKALTEENDVCKKVVKQSLCLAAFPPCDCSSDITACMQNCDLINECARLAKGDKTISICNSCINYCEKSCRLGSAHGLSIGVRHHANDLLFPILALAAFATFVSAVCNRF